MPFALRFPQRFRRCFPQRFPLLSTALLCVGLTAQPPAALAQDRPGFFDVFTLENLGTSLAHTLLSSARFLADIRYGQISVDPLGARLTLLDLDVRPHLPGYPADACTVTAARMTLAGQPLDQPGKARFHIAMDTVEVGMGCLPPEPRGAVYSVGLQQVLLPRIDLDLDYDYASGGMKVNGSVDLASVAAIELQVDADYLSLRLDPETEEPHVALDLNAATLTVDDRGGWQMASRVLPPDIQNPEALQQIVAGAIASALSEANGVSAPQLSDSQQRFAAEAGAVAAAFAQGNRRVVLSTAIDGAPFRLDEDSAAAFQPLFDALAPTLSGHAPRLNQVIPVAVLQSALNSETLPPNALELGRAMLTGIGTPRNVNSGLKLLARASRQGDGQAAFLIAEALADTDPETAYGHALRAAAQNVPGALAVLDMAERGSSFARIIELQNEATPGGPTPELYDSVLNMRLAARAYLNGTGRARSYRAAYYWASMAAAAGDGSGAAIRDEIETLMARRGDRDAWAEEIASLENGVLRDWINENLPERLK